MKRWDIINHFIKKYHYSTYLEIGCQKDTAFNRVEIESRIGVDPQQGGTHRMTSDEFFSMNKKEYKLTFDIIFIDGLHIHPTPYNDVINSLNILNEGGVIVMHDCIPENETQQIVPRISKSWTGDVWKSFIQLRMLGGLEMRVVDTDWGCGIIRKKKSSKPLKIECGPCATKYSSFSLNKRLWLNIISVDQFKKIY